MSSRVGVCTACGRRFRIPETFEGTRAKCKKCGGVIAIPTLDPPPADDAELAESPTGAMSEPTSAPMSEEEVAATIESAEPATVAAHAPRGHPLLAGGAIGLLLVAGATVGFLVMRHDDHAERRRETLAPPAQLPAPPDAHPNSAEPAPSSDAPTPSEPAKTRFEFTWIERAPGTTDEEWGRMQRLAEGLRTAGKVRKKAFDDLLPFGMKAVPILVSSLNGLDLSDSEQWAQGAEVSAFIQDKLTLETILIPYRAEFSTDARQVQRNHNVLKSIVDEWNAQAKDPVRWELLRTRCDEKRAKKESGGSQR